MPRILSLAAGLTGLFMWACQPLPPKHEEEGVFAVTTPLRKDVELTREYVAQVNAIQHIELRNQERGYLTEIFVDEGQLVEEGTKMFQIMPLLYKAELRRAEAEVDTATIEYRNTKLLADKNIVSPAELALGAAKLNRAKAEAIAAIAGKPSPARPAAEVTARKAELKKKNEDNFAKEVEARRKAIAEAPVDAKPAADSTTVAPKAGDKSDK
mgnify:CR=1 FL=1